MEETERTIGKEEEGIQRETQKNMPKMMEIIKRRKEIIQTDIQDYEITASCTKTKPNNGVPSTFPRFDLPHACSITLWGK